MRLRAWVLFLVSIGFAIGVALLPPLAQSPGDAELNALYVDAAALYQAGKYGEAITLTKQFLAGIRARYGENAPKYATALNNLATLLQATNRLAEAAPLMRRALDIDEASFGPNHPEVATDLNNLAQLLQATNRLAEAEPLMRRALRIDEASLGPDHPDVGRVLNILAALREDEGDWSAAVALHVRAKPIMTGAHSASEPGRGSLDKAILAHNTTGLRDYARALYRAYASDTAIRAGGFELAQWALAGRGNGVQPHGQATAPLLNSTIAGALRIFAFP